MVYKKNSFKSALGYNRKIISYYQGRIKIQNKLLKTIKSVLPSSLFSHVHYCVITENKLSLYTDSALWASQLRFYQKNILESVLKEDQSSFEKLQIKIIPKTLEKKSESTFPLLPSKKNIFLILDQAENQQDEKLKNALLKLGNTLRKKKSDTNQVILKARV